MMVSTIPTTTANIIIIIIVVVEIVVVTVAAMTRVQWTLPTALHRMHDFFKRFYSINGKESLCRMKNRIVDESVGTFIVVL